MTPTQISVNRYLQHFGALCGTTAELRKGVCSLVDASGRESVTVEVPDGSDAAFLHCALQKIPDDTSGLLLHRLLTLNFEAGAMRGCWLALNDEQEICLCSLLLLDKCDEQHFSHTLLGFIDQVGDVRDFTARLIEADRAEVA